MSTALGTMFRVNYIPHNRHTLTMKNRLVEAPNSGELGLDLVYERERMAEMWRGLTYMERVVISA